MTKEQLKKCFDLWFEEIRNYIAYRCGDADLATDITQDAFIKVWEKQFEFEGDKTKSLFYKIANDLRISILRKQSTEQKYKLYLKPKLNENQFDNPTENVMNYNELNKKYQEALAKLSHKRREVFLLSRMENLSYREIAEKLEISVKAVEKRMSQAIAELKTDLING